MISNLLYYRYPEQNSVVDFVFPPVDGCDPDPDLHFQEFSSFGFWREDFPIVVGPLELNYGGYGNYCEFNVLRHQFHNNQLGLFCFTFILKNTFISIDACFHKEMHSQKKEKVFIKGFYTKHVYATYFIFCFFFGIRK